MLIDWFTVGAQTLNFLILVWLLKHFLYQPILDAIDAREQRVAKELADADAKMTQATQQHDEFQHKNEAFEQQRAELMKQATTQAQTERQRLLDEAHQAAEALRSKQQGAIKTELQQVHEEIALRSQEEVFAIARQTLNDLAETTLEECMCEVFTRRLRALDGAAKDRMAAALKALVGPALVRSAFELPPEQRAAIQYALNVSFSADISLRFEVAPEVISGIELNAHGCKLSWSISDYLASLEKSIGELLQAPAPAPAPASAPAPVTPESAP